MLIIIWYWLWQSCWEAARTEIWTFPKTATLKVIGLERNKCLRLLSGYIVSLRFAGEICISLFFHQRYVTSEKFPPLGRWGEWSFPHCTTRCLGQLRWIEDRMSVQASLSSLGCKTKTATKMTPRYSTLLSANTGKSMKSRQNVDPESLWEGYVILQTLKKNGKIISLKQHRCLASLQVDKFWNMKRESFKVLRTRSFTLCPPFLVALLLVSEGTEHQQQE